MKFSLDNALTGSLIVLFSDNIKGSFRILNDYRIEEMKVPELLNTSN